MFPEASATSPEQRPTPNLGEETTGAVSPVGSGLADPRGPGGDLARIETEPAGKTAVADTVVAKLAGIAAREVPGVHDLGTGTARALGSLRERLPGQRVSVAQGVAVEVGERQAAIDLDLVIEYGHRLRQVCDAVRRGVIVAVETMAGLEVTEVNIAVTDVHLPGDDQVEGRVQ